MEASLVFEQTRGEQDVEHPEVSFTVSIIFRNSFIDFNFFSLLSALGGAKNVLQKDGAKTDHNFYPNRRKGIQN